MDTPFPTIPTPPRSFLPVDPSPRMSALCHEMEASARDLATRVVAGVYEAPDPGAVTDLASLSLAMLRWSDELRDILAEQDGERYVARLNRGPIARLFRRPERRAA